IITSFFFTVIILLEIKKLAKIEKSIKKHSKERTNLIPCLYQIASNEISKHKEVFYNSLKFKRQEYINTKECVKINDYLFNEKEIEYQIEFIFKICAKHEELNNNQSFIYIKDLIENKTDELYKDINLYKNSIFFINKVILIKNFTIL
ncbi:MAG: hypothetical protein U9Q66_01420, partial [Patescibacteria group bacterium]|nr:hypothetical protein [Patescibacteria group bacterium]